MNYDKLAEAEARFLQVYPRGFADPAIQAVRKKHNVNTLVRFTQSNLDRVSVKRPERVAELMLKVVSRSSMVSRFEKPRFRELVTSLSSDQKTALAHALEQRLFGRRRSGFEGMLELLLHYRIAKWSVISAVPFYFAPRREVFVKPTTAKGILRFLEVEDLRYSATPSWDFYAGYRAVLVEVKKRVHPSLAPNYAALSGFLMMSI